MVAAKEICFYVKEKSLFPFLYYVFVSRFSDKVGKTAVKMKNGSYFPNHDTLIRTLSKQNIWNTNTQTSDGLFQ